MAANHTFDPTAFSRLAAAETDHFWFEQRRLLIAWALGRYFPATPLFCEMGCGTGFVLDELSRRFPRTAFTGIDSYAEGLAYASARLPSRVALREGSILDEPLENEFDVVGCFDVLEHIPDDALALRKLARRLRPRGGLMITVPQHPALWSAADDIGHHQRRYTRPLLIDRLKSAGFRCLLVTSFVTLLLPILWWKRTESLTRDEALAELAPSRLANQIGRLSLRLERGLIAAGLSLPVGGSLLVVAVKTSPDQ